MLVVDVMHEFELGIWKALFSHIIRILYAASPGGRLVALLDERYSPLMSTHYHTATWRPHGLQQHNSTGIAKRHRSVRLSGDLQTTFPK
jgi:hypothetical protein